MSFCQLIFALLTVSSFLLLFSVFQTYLYYSHFSIFSNCVSLNVASLKTFFVVFLMFQAFDT